MILKLETIICNVLQAKYKICHFTLFLFMIMWKLLFSGCGEISDDCAINDEENVDIENVDAIVDSMNVSDSGMTSIAAQGA